VSSGQTAAVAASVLAVVVVAAYLVLRGSSPREGPAPAPAQRLAQRMDAKDPVA